MDEQWTAKSGGGLNRTDNLGANITADQGVNIRKDQVSI